MSEEEFEFEGRGKFSEEHEGDLSFESAREEALENDEIDAEEAGFTAGFNAEDEPQEIESEE